MAEDRRDEGIEVQDMRDGVKNAVARMDCLGDTVEGWTREPPLYHHDR